MEKQNLEVKIQTLQDQITISSQNAENCQKSDDFESAKFLAELEKNSKLLEKLEISNSKIEKLEEKLKNQNVCETPRSNHDFNSSKVDQLREKLTHERDSWAKEKRRLESKIRHLMKKQGLDFTILMIFVRIIIFFIRASFLTNSLVRVLSERDSQRNR